MKRKAGCIMKQEYLANELKNVCYAPIECTNCIFGSGTKDPNKNKNDFPRIIDVFDLPLSPEATKAQNRPSNYKDFSAEDQWAIDKHLGILDWNGK